MTDKLQSNMYLENRILRSKISKLDKKTSEVANRKICYFKEIKQIEISDALNL